METENEVTLKDESVSEEINAAKDDEPIDADKASENFGKTEARKLSKPIKAPFFPCYDPHRSRLKLIALILIQNILLCMCRGRQRTAKFPRKNRI